MAKIRRVAQHRQQSSYIPGHEAPRVPDHGLRIASNPVSLIVEADDETAMHLTDLLEDAGHLVVHTGSLRAARAALASGQRFVLVVLGHALPDGEGMSLLPDIHARLPAVRIVVTAMGSPLMPEGIDVLHRPFDGGRVAQALGLRRADC